MCFVVVNGKENTENRGNGQRALQMCHKDGRRQPAIVSIELFGKTHQDTELFSGQKSTRESWTHGVFTGNIYINAQAKII